MSSHPHRPSVLHRPPAPDTHLPTLTICAATTLARAAHRSLCSLHCCSSFSDVLISYGHTCSEHVHTALDIPSLPCSHPVATSTFPGPHSSTTSVKQDGCIKAFRAVRAVKVRSLTALNTSHFTDAAPVPGPPSGTGMLGVQSATMSLFTYNLF
jgi:hypothetical protein